MKDRPVRETINLAGDRGPKKACIDEVIFARSELQASLLARHATNDIGPGVATSSV